MRTVAEIDRLIRRSSKQTKRRHRLAAGVRQLDYSKGRYEELLQNYRQAVISAFSNVEDALAATRRTAEQQESQLVAVAKARRAYDIVQLQYGAGSTDLLTALNTENALFSANDLLAQIRIARMQALVSLFNALGGEWQDGGSQAVATAATLR